MYSDDDDNDDNVLPSAPDGAGSSLNIDVVGFSPGSMSRVGQVDSWRGSRSRGFSDQGVVASSSEESTGFPSASHDAGFYTKESLPRNERNTLNPEVVEDWSRRQLRHTVVPGAIVSPSRRAGGLQPEVPLGAELHIPSTTEATHHKVQLAPFGGKRTRKRGSHSDEEEKKKE